MNLKDILLNKEELPIINGTCFYVPLHPALLDSNNKMNPELAYDVFFDAAKEWGEDLTLYAKSLLDKTKKEWIENVFLSKNMKCIETHGVKRLYPLNWEADARIDSNGFASLISISRNGGGTLYYNGDEYDSYIWVQLHGNKYIRFNEDKVREYSIEMNEKSKAGKIRVYSQHNIDSPPGAFFLRNWAILYNNAALKEVLSNK